MTTRTPMYDNQGVVQNVNNITYRWNGNRKTTRKMSSVNKPEMKYSVQLATTKTKPLSRSSHGISMFDHKVFVFGGEHTARIPIGSQLYSLDLTSTNPDWVEVEVENAPPPRVAHAQTIVGSWLYIFGGRQGIHMNEAPLNDMYRINLASSTTLRWEKVELTGDIPCERSFHGICSGQNCNGGSSIYVFGGCGASGRMNDVHELDLETLVWKEHPSCDDIIGRGGACFFCVDQSLYVVCGFIGEETNDAYSYNLKTNEWRVETGVTGKFRPRSVCGHSVFHQNGQDYLAIFGGEVNPSEKGHEGAGGFSNDLLLFSINNETGQLDAVIDCALNGTAATPRGWTTMVSDNCHGRLLMFGGLSGSDEAPNRLDDTVILDIACK